jgi:hypothetical protein
LADRRLQLIGRDYSKKVINSNTPPVGTSVEQTFRLERKSVNTEDGSPW